MAPDKGRVRKLHVPPPADFPPPPLQGHLFSTGLVPEERVSLGYKGEATEQRRLYRGVLQYLPVNLVAGGAFSALVCRMKNGFVQPGTKFVRISGTFSYTLGDGAMRSALRLPEAVRGDSLADHSAVVQLRIDADGVLTVWVPPNISIRGCRVRYNKA